MLMDTVIIFPEMTVIGTLACANITIIDDSILEPDQEFTVQVVDSDPPGVVSRELSTTVTIEDNDSKSVFRHFEELFRCAENISWKRYWISITIRKNRAYEHREAPRRVQLRMEGCYGIV